MGEGEEDGRGEGEPDASGTVFPDLEERLWVPPAGKASNSGSKTNGDHEEPKLAKGVNK